MELDNQTVQNLLIAAEVGAQSLSQSDKLDPASKGVLWSTIAGVSAQLKQSTQQVAESVEPKQELLQESDES